VKELYNKIYIHHWSRHKKMEGSPMFRDQQN
jgi:hypothetical protein